MQSRSRIDGRLWWLILHRLQIAGAQLPRASCDSSLSLSGAAPHSRHLETVSKLRPLPHRCAKLQAVLPLDSDVTLCAREAREVPAGEHLAAVRAGNLQATVQKIALIRRTLRQTPRYAHNLAACPGAKAGQWHAGRTDQHACASQAEKVSISLGSVRLSYRSQLSRLLVNSCCTEVWIRYSVTVDLASQSL